MSLKTLALQPKQGVALKSRATEILYGGAVYGGKSHLLRVLAIYFCAAVPGLQCYLFRRTFPDLWKNHMEGPGSFRELLADWVSVGRVKINETQKYIEFWNGSKIFLCHCQHEKDVYSYQGAQIQLLLIDEITHFTRKMYLYLRGRVRLGSLELPREFVGVLPRIVCGGNPGGIGHNWVKADWIDIQPPMAIKQMDAKNGGMLRQYIPAKLEDNAIGVRNDPSYEDRLSGLGSPELVKALRDGRWDIVAGGMFDDLWTPDTHVLGQFDIPSSWRLDRSFDWGDSKPFSVGFWAESDGTPANIDGKLIHLPRGSVVRVAEWYGWNGTPNEGIRLSDEEIAKGIKKFEEEIGLKGRVQPGPADTSIFSGTPNAESPASIQAKHGVRWLEADKTAGSRARGWAVIRNRLKAALADKPESPGLWVSENCTQFIRTVPVLQRKDTDPNDIDTAAEDHIADETRYRLTAPKRSIYVGTFGWQTSKE